MNEEWFYGQDGQRHGPHAFPQLQVLAQQGKLAQTDLVWKEGMSEWVPASRVKGLEWAPITNQTIRPRTVNDEMAQDRHPLDYLLNGIRGIFSVRDFDQINRVLVGLGLYSLYLAMGAGLLLTAVISIKTNQVDVLFYGFGVLLGGLVLQYSAVRISRTIERLIRATPIRMSSTAFLDTLSAVLLVFGVLALAGGILFALRVERFSFFLAGFGVFMVLESCALVAMNPTWLNLDITPQATCGEEAIGIITLFMMMPLRVVPLVFGLGSALGTLGLFLSGAMILNGGERALSAMLIAIQSTLVVVICAAFPFLTYLYFLSYYLFIDVIRSVLVLPSKLDDLSAAQGKKPNKG